VPDVPREVVLRLYDEGVDAFAAQAGAVTVEGWAQPTCGEWSGAQLTRHVAAVAGWYHDWLDRAERSDATPPFSGEELGVQNERALDALGALDGPMALELFVTRARAYRDRLPAAWDLPYGYPRGTVTAGLHAALATTEWHLHAWDLAQASGDATHRPSDPVALYRAAGACLTAVTGGFKGRVAEVLVPVGAHLRPWEAMLRRSGRAPGPGD
jgi:uncharacterized protein (TIGR03083 family)